MCGRMENRASGRRIESDWSKRSEEFLSCTRDVMAVHGLPWIWLIWDIVVAAREQPGWRERREWKLFVETIAPDLLNQNFTAEEPNRIWTTDVSYSKTKGGCLYLIIILDIFHRFSVGWSVSNSLRAEETSLAALQYARLIYNPGHGVIVHSDKGSAFTCHDFRALIERFTMVQSMNRCNCYDNSITETFFHTLKQELVYPERFKDKSNQECKLLLFEYIEGYYNRRRRHSALDYLTPVQFLERKSKHAS